MAIQTTMGHHSDVHFSRRAIYWTIGIVVALLLAIGLSMSRTSRAPFVDSRTSVQDTRGTASDSNNVNGSSDSGGYQKSSPATDGTIGGAQ